MEAYSADGSQKISILRLSFLLEHRVNTSGQVASLVWAHKDSGFFETVGGLQVCCHNCKSRSYCDPDHERTPAQQQHCSAQNHKDNKAHQRPMCPAGKHGKMEGRAYTRQTVASSQSYVSTLVSVVAYSSRSL